MVHRRLRWVLASSIFSLSARGSRHFHIRDITGTTNIDALAFAHQFQSRGCHHNNRSSLRLDLLLEARHRGRSHYPGLYRDLYHCAVPGIYGSVIAQHALISSPAIVSTLSIRTTGVRSPHELEVTNTLRCGSIDIREAVVAAAGIQVPTGDVRVGRGRL